jgi:hypothetical protein
MKEDLVQVIENATLTAKKIIGSTEAIRNSVAQGRPNSSSESTVNGTLNAMNVIVDNYVPTWYDGFAKNR